MIIHRGDRSGIIDRGNSLASLRENVLLLALKAAMRIHELAGVGLGGEEG